MRANVEDVHKLSPVQQGILFHGLAEPEGGAYHDQFSFALEDGVDVDAFRRAWQRLLDRHPVLRSFFLWDGLEEPVQVVARQVPVEWQEVDLRGVAREEQPERIRAHMAADRRRGFDLQRPPLTRVALLRLGESSYHLVWSYHHLLLDGWSAGLVLQEMAELYRAEKTGAAVALAERRPFKEFIGWLRRQDLAAAEEYFRRALAGAPAPTLPVYARPAGPRPGELHKRLAFIDRADTERLTAFARRERLTLPTLATAAWALVLARSAAEGRPLFGLTVSGRPPALPAVDAMLGCFINTLPLALPVAWEVPVRRWLGEVQGALLELRRHEVAPLVQVRRWGGLAADRPPFEAIFVFESFGAGSASRSGDYESFQRTNFPLTGGVMPVADGLHLAVAVDLERLDGAAADRLVEHFREVLLALPEAVERPVAALPSLSAAERDRVLAEWSRSPSPTPAGGLLHQLFFDQAAREPGRMAAVWEGERLAYGELAERAVALAHRLVALGVGPETVVGICLPRSFDMLVAVLGTLRAGAAFLPLDPAYPPDRLAFMVEDSRAPLVLTTAELSDLLPPGPRRLLVSEVLAVPVEAAVPLPEVDPAHAAYVIYTSGSTGRPKGVVVAHDEVTRRIRFAATRNLSPDCAFLQKTSLSFDVSVAEILAPLAAGGRTVLARTGGEKDAPYLARLVAAEGITHASFPPTLLGLLLDDPSFTGSTTLVNVITGGEVVPADLPERFYGRLPATELENRYGPTEATISVTGWVCPREEREPVLPIGRPFPGVEVYLLDPSFQPVPVGVPGQIALGGPCLARGYLDRPARTAEAFVPHPFATAPGQRLYLTGDLGRFRADGALVFAGRTDRQVKIRGYRVELGEVESALRREEGVREAVAVDLLDGDTRRLAAYVVPEETAALSDRALKEALGKTLPDHMVPSAVVFLDALPLGPTGKVDRSALPPPSWQREEDRMVPPATPVEEIIAGIWAAVLGLERVGVTDDFFDLGGHSLLVGQVLSRLRETFGVELPLKSLFEDPTVRGLGAAVELELHRSELPAAPAIEAVSRDRPLPLSFAQERLWFLDRLEPGAAHYLVPLPLRLHGTLDHAAFAAALTEVMRRHEALRTVFATHEGRPVQVIRPPAALPLPRVDLSALAPLDGEDERIELLRAAFRRPMGLERGPLLTVRHLHWDGSEHLLLLVVHHIIADAWSVGVLVREVGVLYRAYREGRPSPLPGLPLQYADYAAWQRRWLAGEVLERQLAYWREHLAGAPQVLELPTDRPRPAVETFRGKTRHRVLPAAAAAAVKALGRDRGATLFMTGLAGFLALLARFTGQRDLLVGTPIANRGRLELEGLIGFFLNTLVLRGDLSGDPTFEELLARVRNETLGAYSHQDLPFEQLVQELKPDRDLARSPFFQVMFVLQTEGEGGRVDLPDLEQRLTVIPADHAKFDLTLSAAEADGRLILSLEYNRDIFDRTTIERLLRGYERLLTAAVADPARPLSRLPLLPPAEEHQLLREWSDSTAPVPTETLPQLLRERAAAGPEREAVVGGAERLTYRELFARVDRLAARLRRLRVGPEDPVGVLLPRGVDAVVAVLAVLEAGGAYVPLDPAHPAERRRYVLEDAGVKAVITDGTLEQEVAGLPFPRLRIDRVEDGVETAVAGAGEGPAPAPENLAYLLYTSGSTGRPKGVAVPHGALVNLLQSVHRWPGMTPEDTLLAVTTLAFDIAGVDLFLPLLTGARLVMAPAEALADGPALLALLRESGATWLQATPATWRLLLASGLSPAPGLRAISTGEALPPDLARELTAAGVELWDLYGPTETTIWSSGAHLAAGEPVHLGRPIANTRLAVADDDGRPVPVGVPGELFIGGAGLARGYHRRPALSAERFRPDPYGPPGARRYATGDRVRYRPDGTLEYLGRLDHQVKVRGFRIELAEIEAVLGEHPAVAQAVVVARREGADDVRLVAYLTVHGEAPEPAELHAHGAAKLPPYMLPGHFEVLPELPLSASGKVDRKALLARPLARRAVAVAPGTAVEKAVAEVWCGVLGIERVALDDSFFEVGGHSLLLLEVQRRLEERFGRPIPVADLFRHPTVRGLARALAGESAAPAAAVAASAPRPAGSTAIAVVAMTGRFPGAADLAELWDLLAEGREGITFFGEDELLAAGVPRENLADPRYVRARGDIAGRELFDAAFFGYSPREAEILDPQQRLFLEHAWEALEAAGCDPERFPGRVGVFAGMGMNTYLLHLLARPDLMAVLGRFQTVIANDKDFLPTRVSYKLDLKGPSINVQTACSTSLVAVALGCDSLVSGASDLVLAGGVTVHTAPPTGYRYEEQGIASPDGHTRTFDARGRGTVPSSGVGVVVLKRLDDALAAGDSIRAVIRGWALNNDGADKVGYTAPGVVGQAEVIAQALARAGVDPATVGYVEAHGTATPLGDPIELTALAQALGEGAAAAPVVVGSIKSNLGHTDAAAGVAGLIKTVLALEHGAVPPSLHFTAPNPAADFRRFQVPTALTPWPDRGGPRRAGVSSFGIGGTNAHLVLEEAPPVERSAPARDPELLVLSARTPAALETASGNLARYLEGHPEANLGDVAFTLQTGRRHFPHRRIVVAGDAAGAARALTDPGAPGTATVHDEGRQRPVVFLFPGSGAQYPAMARGLYDREPVFRAELDRSAEVLLPLAGFDLREVLYGAGAGDEEAAARLRRTGFAHPALVAVEIALARLWMAWGVTPRAMLGHSLGEYTAAHLSGVLTLEDALALVALRGQLFETLPAGSILAVALPAEELIPRLPAELSLAAVNTPRLCAVSGPAAAVAAFEQALAAEGTDATRLHIDMVAHSPLVEPILEPLTERARAMRPGAPAIPYPSNRTGTWITVQDAQDPTYWSRHLRGTVRFSAGLEAIFAAAGDAVLLEVGPGQTLATLARQHPARPAAMPVSTSLRHPKEETADRAVLLGALGRLWAAGVEVDWAAHHGGARRRRLALPTYPFERRRFWIDYPAAGRSPEDAAGPTAPVPEVPAVTPESGPPAGSAAPQTPLEEQLAAAFRELLGVPRVGIHDDFFELGGSSLLALRLAARLGPLVGRELSPHFLLEAPTVARLAALLEAEGAAVPAAPEAVAAASCLVPLHGGDGGGNGHRPLFLVHPVGGHVYFYRGLAAGLGGAVPVYGLRARGAVAGEEPLASVPEMAAHYLEELRRVTPAGPYRLGGSSMGGLVAYEMAQQLAAGGERVELLALLDTPVPGALPSPPEDDAAILDYLLRGRLPLSLEELRRRSPEEQLEVVVREARESGLLPPDLDLAGARRLVNMVRAHFAALFAYQPRPYPGKLVFLRATERQRWDAAYPEREWIELAAGGVEVHLVPGNHVSMHHPPHLTALARTLRASLEGLVAAEHRETAWKD
jgi:amino acid adenylation domain-containing protein